MKIGIVCQNFPPASFEGGISHYSEALARNLRSMGHDIIIFTSTEFMLKNYGPVKHKNIKIIPIKGPWGFRAIWSIRQIVSQNSIDTIILQYSPASFKISFRFMWSIIFYSCQKITAFHTLWGKGADRLIGLSILFGSKKIIATNSEIMVILQKHFPFLLKKTYWIPIASNISMISGIKSGIGENPPIISYFGMLYSGKGIDLILNCLFELQKRGHKFKFNFLGGGMLNHRSYEIEFRNKIFSKNLDNVVYHMGILSPDEVSKRISESKFMFMPYERGLSDRRGTFMAAIAHGKAVLTSPPIVKMPFLINGFNVLWPEQANLKGYVEMLESMLTNKIRLKNIENQAKILSQQFSWKNIAKEYELVLNKK